VQYYYYYGEREEGGRLRLKGSIMRSSLAMMALCVRGDDDGGGGERITGGERIHMWTIELTQKGFSFFPHFSQDTLMNVIV
jgi:hypothetical protein